jgi:SAM-dependent methyltransferase
MSHHAQHHDQQHDDQHGHGQQHGHDQHQRVLDLDAQVFGAQLTAVLDLLGPVTPARVVDLGAGTGTGTRLLGQRFPQAAVTAVDNSATMLERLRHEGFATLEADLDAGFPDLVEVDLVWMSSALHHVGDPARLLAGARAALAPGGQVVVVEVDGLPEFLRTPLETRAHAAAAADGWNHHPDWTPVLQGAGFSVDRHRVPLEPPADELAAQYARAWLPRFLGVPGLSAADRTELAALLEGPFELRPRATRSVWIGRAS